jgi:alpha-mannosidase
LEDTPTSPLPETSRITGFDRRRFLGLFGMLSLAPLGWPVEGAPSGETRRPVFIVPNFHPASCGWLTTFSKERVYCANSYLNHLDRVRDDPQYEFVMSEVNNVIAIMNFQPARIAELKQRITERRVEIVNGYFLESTINLSGGEALMRLGVEGLRWYEAVFGVKPRFSWNIDVCGTHEQMPQIALELGLEALVYTRKNPTGKTLFWSVSPDGSKILTLCPGHYSEAGALFNSKTPLSPAELAKVNVLFDTKEPITPASAPLLVLAGSGDYALAPVVKSYPTQLLSDWKNAQLGRELRFSTLSKYLDTVRPGIDSGEIAIPTSLDGTAYDFDAFWIENPEVKTRYRRNEHELQAAEILATAAYLKAHHLYPAKDLNDAWILMCLNMDRNTLWGSAGGMVFVDRESWDVSDRFEWVRGAAARAIDSAGKEMLGSGDGVGLFNALNWHRRDPFEVRLPEGKSLSEALCQALPDGSALVLLDLPPVSIGGLKLSDQAPASPRSVSPSAKVESRHYIAQLDPKTGDLTSLKWKSSGRELLSAPVNVVVAERPMKMPRMGDDPGDFMPPRPSRKRLRTSSDQPLTVSVVAGPVATIVETKATFYGGGVIRRVMRLYHDHPRIDFQTELNDIPNFTVVVSEFPLAEEITEIRRGIPFGFSHGGWSKPNADLHGWTKGIVPAVRWVDYALSGGGGVAIFDRGCSGRELDQRTPIIYLLNAEDKYYGYPNAWLSGKGKHMLEYSMFAHEDDWLQAQVPYRAWEYNSPPFAVQNAGLQPAAPFIETSENLILEATRREDNYIELRLLECLGLHGTAQVTVSLPHTGASLTDAMGKKKSDLSNGPRYKIPVRPQQILTLRLTTDSTVLKPEPITRWDTFVREAKLAALHAYDPNTIGHPPKGS